jgi:beta-N-acetylhexosaminidase
MSAHVLYPEVDSDHCGTLSAPISRQLLREDLGYEGVLFSDDLLMKGVCEQRSVPEAAEQSLRAGCDAVLICRDFDLQQQTVEHLKKRVEADAALYEAMGVGAQRMRNLLARLSQTPSVGPEALDAPELMGVLTKIADTGP